MPVLDAEIERRALDAARVLGRAGVVKAVYVFGSQVTGDTDEWSDIDVAVFMNGIDAMEYWDRIRLMGRVQREAGWDVEPHLFPASDLEHAEPGSFASYILKHGVRIL